MRLLISGFAAALCGTLLFAPRAADAQRLDANYVLEDSIDPVEDRALFEISGTSAEVRGSAESVGTGGDAVTIEYITNTPTHLNADEKQARIRQSSFSQIFFTIDSETPARDLDLELSPQKCQIDAKVQADKGTGDVTVKCSADDLFAEFTADQLASLQAAFLNYERVKIKVKSDGSKGSISVKLKGTALEVE